MSDVERVRAVFDEVIQTPGYPPLARFGKFAREDVAVLFDRIDHLERENAIHESQETQENLGNTAENA